MRTRGYRQNCALAHALDRLDGRWTLLVVRELLTGPKRYKDLLDNLQGIGTNLLAARLRRLERDGIVRRATLPPPAASAVYELTDRGAGLEPAVLALVGWGLGFLEDPRRDLSYRASWAAVAMRQMFRADAARGVLETYEYRVGDEVFHARVADGRLETRLGAADRPDLVVTTDPGTLQRLATGRLAPRAALRSGRIEIDGDRAAFDRSIELFSVPPRAATARPGSRGSRRAARRA